MKNIIRYTSVALLAAVATVDAAAQDLSTEITVDRTIVPQEQAVKPLPSVVPSVLPPNASKASIRLAEFSRMASFGPSSGKMETPLYKGLPEPDSYRGYVWGGYFPAYNLGVGAGYRLIDTKNTLLGVAAQFDGYSYDSDVDAEDKGVSNNTYGAQAYFSQRLGDNMRLGVDVNGSGASVKSPFAVFDNKRSLTMFDAKVGIEGSSKSVSYDAALVADYFKVGVDGEHNLVGGPYREPSDMLYGFNGRVRYRHSGFGLEMGVDALLRQREGEEWIMLPHGPAMTDIKGDNSGLYSFNPAFTLRGHLGELRLGARLDVASGSDNGSFHVSPDVILTAKPGTQMTIYARLGGGERYNTLSGQYQYSPFMSPWGATTTSFTPVDGRAGFIFGPFSGFTIELYARYAATRRAQMLTEVDGWGAVFMERNLSGWGAGADIRYSPASFLDLAVAGSLNPHSYASGFADNMDRAKAVVKASADIRPIDRLTVGLGYELRTGRRYYRMTSLGEGAMEAVEMHNVSDLSVSASYRLMQQLTIFARGENLLGHRFLVMPGVTGLKVHGLVGALYRF